MLTMHWQSEDIVITEESPTLASVVDDKKKNATIDTDKKDDGNDSASSSGNLNLINPHQDIYFDFTEFKHFS